MGVLTQGDGLRQRHDLLAASARLDRGGRMAVCTFPPAPRIGPRWTHQLGTCFAGRHVGSGKKGGPKTGPNPCDRGRPGSKHHVLCDGNGTPLCCPLLTAANVNETTMLEPMVDAVEPIQGPRGRPRKRPKKLHADKAYHSAKNRAALRRRGIVPRIARPGVESREKLGRHRWKVERTIAWLYGHRRLRIRWERRDDIHLGFMGLACCLVVFHILIGGFC